MRVGVLTGGGDCPGLNALLRAVVRKAERHFGDEVIGFLDAWDGVMERRTRSLTIETMRGVLPRGGTDVQRGGTPTAFDRVLSTRMGVAAIEAAHDAAWGQMMAVRGTSIVHVPLADVAGRTRPVDVELFDGVAEVFFA